MYTPEFLHYAWNNGDSFGAHAQGKMGANDRFVVQLKAPVAQQGNDTIYFEAKVVNCSKYPFIFGIGLASKYYSQGMTGWYSNSIGYHSDDGLVYDNSGNSQAQNHLEVYGVNDVVGCLFDRASGRIAFTKNGKLFSKEFVRVNQQQLLPTFTFQEPDLQFRVNMGDKKFRYVPPPPAFLNIFGPQDSSQPSFYRVWSSENAVQALNWQGGAFEMENQGTISNTAQFASQEQKKLLAIMNGSSLVGLLDETNEQQEENTKAVVWVPTSQVRPGSAIKGLALVRSVSSNNSLSAAKENAILELFNPSNEKKRVLKIEKEDLAQVFSFDTSVQDEVGTWTIKLMQGSTELGKQQVELVHFEKLDIEMAEIGVANLLLNSNQQKRFHVKYMIEGVVSHLEQVKFSVKSSNKIVLEKNMSRITLQGGELQVPTITNSIGDFSWQLDVVDAQKRKGTLSGEYKVISEEVKFIISQGETTGQSLEFEISAIDLRTDEPISDIEIVALFAEKSAAQKLDANGKLKGILDRNQFSSNIVQVRAQLQYHGKQYSTTNVLTFAEPFSGLLQKTQPKLSFMLDKSVYQAGEQIIIVIKAPNQPNGTAGSAELINGSIVASQAFFIINESSKITLTIPSNNVKINIMKLVVQVNTATEGFLKEEQPVKLIGVSNPSIWQAAITGEKKYATGKPISVHVSIPHSGKARVVAYLIDRRINREKTDLKSFLEKKFTFEHTMEMLKLHKITTYPISSSTNMAKEFVTKVAKNDWYIVAGTDPSNSTKIIALRSPFAKSMINSPFSELAKLFTLKFFTTERVSKFLKHFASALSIEEIQIFSGKQGNSYPEPPFVWPVLETHLLLKIPELLEVQHNKEDFLLYKKKEVAVQQYPQPNIFFGGLRSSSLGFGGQNRLCPQEELEISENPFSDPFMSSPIQAQSFLRSASPSFQYADHFSMSDSVPSQEKNMKRSMKPKIISETKMKQKIVRENYIEVEQVQLDTSSNEVDISFKGTDSITEYDLIVFVIQENKLGVGNLRVQVSNQIFSKLINVAQMLWNDVTTVTSIVQNMGNQSLQNVKLTVASTSCIELEGQANNLIIPQVLPGQSVAFDWFVKAKQVGDAKLSLVMETNEMIEESKLDTPLRVNPIGRPFVKRVTGAIDQKNPQMFLQVPKSGIYTLITVSILPQSSAAALIEGAESLMEYPHGCCEQSYSSTLPNFILWTYLKRVNMLTASKQATLEKYLTAGYNRFVDTFYNNASGGFGLWNNSNPAVFHTALILSLFVKIQQVMPQLVNEKYLKGAWGYLQQRMTPRGTWDPVKHSYNAPFPDNTMTEVGCTSFIFHSCSMANIELKSTLQFIKDNWPTIKNDYTSVALILDALCTNHSYSNEAALKSACLLEILNNQQPDGSWLSGPTSMTGGVETTAYCIMAVGKTIATDQVRAVIGKGIDFILKNRTAKGWNSTRDTLYASYAIGECGHLAWNVSSLSGKVSISLNDKVQKVFDFATCADEIQKMDLCYQCRRVYLDQLEPWNVLKVEGDNNFTGNVVVETSTYDPAAPVQPPMESNVLGTAIVGVELSKSEISVGESVDFKVSIQHMVPVLDAVLVEVPIPSGFIVDAQATIALNNNNAAFSHFEVKNNLNAACFFSDKLPQQSALLVRFTSQTVGRVQVNPVQVYQMYKTYNAVSSYLKQILVTPKSRGIRAM